MCVCVRLMEGAKQGNPQLGLRCDKPRYKWQAPIGFDEYYVPVPVPASASIVISPAVFMPCK